MIILKREKIYQKTKLTLPTLLKAPQENQESVAESHEESQSAIGSG